MRLFGLTVNDPYTNCLDYFEVRRAERLEEYLVTLLVESEGPGGSRSRGGGELFNQLLTDVVLRHVYNLNALSVKVACYDNTIDAVVLTDSAPLRRQIPTHRGYVVSGEVRVYELETGDQYVVPVDQIMKQLTTACIHDGWTLLEFEDLPPCRSLAELSPQAKQPEQPQESEEPVEPVEAGVARSTKKRVLDSDSE